MIKIKPLEQRRRRSVACSIEACRLSAELQFVQGRIRFYRNMVHTMQWQLIALGDENRYFASQALGRPATDEEAYWHFIQSGGKAAFDKAHPEG